MADMDPRTGKLDSLTISCTCGYTVTWPRKAILAKAGPWRRPMELGYILRCTACGVRGKARISGTKY